MPKRIVGPLYDRLDNFTRRGESCWEWIGAVTPKGYGIIDSGSHKGKPVHRVAYERVNGPIPQGLVIDHICHNRRCVNPAHLRAVTNKQNGENRVGANRNNANTSFRGVSLRTDGLGWRARLMHSGRRIDVGTFATAEAANAAVIDARNRFYTHNDADRAS